MAAVDVAPPTIQLHLKVEPDADSWIHALSIPPQALPRLTRHPYKYLRYVAYTILGSDGSLHTADGHSPDPNSPLPKDLDSLVGSYYFTTNS